MRKDKLGSQNCSLPTGNYSSGISQLRLSPKLSFVQEKQGLTQTHLTTKTKWLIIRLNVYVCFRFTKVRIGQMFRMCRTLSMGVF